MSGNEHVEAVPPICPSFRIASFVGIGGFDPISLVVLGKHLVGIEILLACIYRFNNSSIEHE